MLNRLPYRILFVLAILVAVGAVFFVVTQEKNQPERFITPTLYRGPENDLSEQEQFKNQFLKHYESAEAISEFFTSTVQEIDPRSLAIDPTSVIADLGCGTGAFEIAMLEKKVPFSKIYAVDVDKKSLDLLKFVLDTTGLEGKEKIILHHSMLDDVMLPNDSIDVALIYNTRIGMRETAKPLHQSEIEMRTRLFESLKKALKPGAKVHVYEPRSTVKDENRVYPEEYVSEPYLANGFKLILKKRVTMVEEYYYHIYVDER